MKRELRQYMVKMSLLEKCYWSLHSKDHVKGLIKCLRRYNDDLIRLCSWEAQSRINRGLPTFTIPQSQNFIDLHLMADISKEVAEDKASPLAEGRQLTATMARFRAKVMTPAKISNRYQPQWRLLKEEDYNILSRSHAYSLGTSSRTQDPIFVEWRSFIGNDGRPNKSAEEQVQQLGDFLSVPNRPLEFRSLDCIGLLKDEANAQYGLVHELPKRLRGLRSENRRIYNPSTLTDLMHDVDGMVDLGIRFDLAKKLLYSLVVLHTCGWLHKDICSDNILFFAARPSVGETVKTHRKDVGRPIIIGYGISRLDGVPIERGPRNGTSYSMAPFRPSGKYNADNKDKSKYPHFNIYQHPDKVTNPSRRYRHSYDIYSLGLVLLEIGLWQSLQKFDLDLWKSAPSFRTFVLDRLVPDLWGQCGSIYGGIVKQCLTLNSSDATLAEQGQRSMAWNLAEKLDQCCA